MVMVDVAGVEPAFSPHTGLPYTPVCLVDERRSNLREPCRIGGRPPDVCILA